MSNICGLIKDMSIATRTNKPSWFHDEISNLDFYKLFQMKRQSKFNTNTAEFLLDVIDGIIFTQSDFRNKLLSDTLINGEWVINKFYTNISIGKVLEQVDKTHHYNIGVKDALYICKDLVPKGKYDKADSILAELEECLEEKLSEESFIRLYRIFMELSAQYNNNLADNILPTYNKYGNSNVFRHKLSSILFDLEELGNFLNINVKGEVNQKWFNFMSALYRKDKAKQIIGKEDNEVKTLLQLIHNDLIEEWTPELLILAVTTRNYKDLMKHDKWNIIPVALSYIANYTIEDNYRDIIKYCESKEDFNNELNVIVKLREHLPIEVIDVKYETWERRFKYTKEELKKLHEEELQTYKKSKKSWASNRDYILKY